jgi:periodic tryptophan protein 2
MSCLDYSPNGSLICTGGDDGKVKAWNATSGFCFITFTEHTAPVKAVVFTPKGNAVVSASLDGSVRAFDLTRYRNFRTLTTPKPQQFCSLALDHSGEIVCAGTQDSFEIFVWSMQTGRLLDVLAGHEGPVSSLAFSPTEAILASGSWDKTVKLWDIFETKTATQSLPHQVVKCLAFFCPLFSPSCGSSPVLLFHPPSLPSFLPFPLFQVNEYASTHKYSCLYGCAVSQLQ